MTSKVNGKTRLGAVCCVLLIAIALFAGCKQETPESYAPPGYGVSVGPLTDSTWTYEGKSFKFEANGNVSVPDSLKTKTLNGETIELGDFTYKMSGNDKVIISGIVKKLPNGEKSQTFTYKDEYYSSLIVINVGDTTVIETLTINGKKSATSDSTDVIGPYAMITEDYETTYKTTVPTEENYVGSYFDELGRKIFEINKDGTCFSYENGNRIMKYWKYVSDNNLDKEIYKGTIWVAVDEELLAEDISHDTYVLYPHALISGNKPYWK